MDELYKNKYRITSARRPNWDYGSHGLYFVTICTKDRVRYFGEIVEDEIQGIVSLRGTVKFAKGETQGVVSLRGTDIGKIAYDNWFKISDYHPYVQLDEFVVMPDHIHGILFINKPDKMDWQAGKFGPQKNNLASIIRGYKSSVKQYAAINNIDFQWQPKYYDRVIRDEREYLNIKEYIYNNVDNWFSSKDNFENLCLP